MKKKVISLLICSALMMVEGVTYAQTMASEPSNNSKIESSAEEKEQKKSKETSEEAEEKQAEEITETKEIVETIEENPVEDIEENDTFIEDEEIIENKGESKAVKIMNVIIVILVIIFIALLGVILYQSFF